MRKEVVDEGVHKTSCGWDQWLLLLYFDLQDDMPWQRCVVT